MFQPMLSRKSDNRHLKNTTDNTECIDHGMPIRYHYQAPYICDCTNIFPMQVQLNHGQDKNEL